MALLWHIRIFIDPITAHFSVVPFPIFTFTVALQYVALQYVSAIGIELAFREKHAIHVHGVIHIRHMRVSI